MVMLYPIDFEPQYLPSFPDTWYLQQGPVLPKGLPPRRDAFERARPSSYGAATRPCANTSAQAVDQNINRPYKS